MDLFIFAGAYALGTACFIFILLFGESPYFRGTLLEKAHWLLTNGLCNCCDWLVARTCGARGSQALDRAYTACCDRPNPLLQVAYLVMLGAGLWIYWTNLFALLPNPWVDAMHVVTGTGCVLVCLAFFVAACRSDPGTVRREDLAAWAALYPLDGVLFPAKHCATCGMQRPARAKHCGVCGRCVGRHDHHCQWINNCVGYANTRLFLAFLAANLLMCGYGAGLAAAILGGEMARRGLLDVKLVNYRTGAVVPLWRVPGKMIEWLVFFYPLGVAMGLFMFIATFLMAAFLSYQIYLLYIGRTQYEQYKWRDLHHSLLDLAIERQRQQEEQLQEERQQLETDIAEGAEGQGHASGAAGEKDRGSGKGGFKGKGRGGKGVLRRLWDGMFGSGVQVQVQLPPNSYHRGFWGNAREVLFPAACFAEAREAARWGVTVDELRTGAAGGSGRPEGDAGKGREGQGRGGPGEAEGDAAGGRIQGEAGKAPQARGRSSKKTQ